MYRRGREEREIERGVGGGGRGGNIVTEAQMAEEEGMIKDVNEVEVE